MTSQNYTMPYKVRDTPELLMIYFQIIVDLENIIFFSWLRAITLYECFDDGNEVLQHMFHTIHIIEQIEEKTFCTANAYLAISKYYCAFLKYYEVCYFI